ncbi:hypothetical protein DSM112329_02729 [Paraconexibacter sp. AEG42_29]|uniref:DUF1772 domain-containing protein n=1 Tax=Paraconexibacter sp. AEG42_29 TaxID=2997339 RepID=A0AAU7AVZ8_9ACTN
MSSRTPAAAAAAAPQTVDAAGLALGVAVLATGLMAGLFYAYACSVMPGLAKASDRTALEAMQRINTAIMNPVFFAGFLGAPAAALVALVLEHRDGAGPVARWVLAGLVLYGVVVVVTGAANVPLNDELARADLSRQGTDLAALRDRFEDTWVLWNVVRTVACVAAFGCLGRALMLHGQSVIAAE